MRTLVGLAVLSGFSCFCAVVASGAVERTLQDVPYRLSDTDCATGDILLPSTVKRDTPVLLCIHGGGWNGMSRKDVSGIAEFFRQELGFVVYNVDYRLAGKHPWPACGEDCVKAAEFLLSDAFARKTGVAPSKIWLCGASAGGHLALWTLVNLPARSIEGVISISSIADPSEDFVLHPRRYSHFFGFEPDVASLASMDPCRRVAKGLAPVLCTHAEEDEVVPVSSHRVFLKAAAAAGNRVEFFSYHRDDEENTGGHCIWRPRTNPRRLLACLERRISGFVRSVRGIGVPLPRPVGGPIEVHAFYYPGTDQMSEWDQVEEVRPGIKPLLGWYDESNPEVVDWQIKWAVEHGISAFCVDWYWNRGERRLTHWLDAYAKARHRRFLKWYVMYANHNGPGTHSTEDQIAITRHWIDKCFGMPEYYQIDGRPVVVYWSFDALDDDFREELRNRGKRADPGNGVRYALELSERIARESGLPGIYFIDMFHGAFRPEGIDRARCAGYAAQMVYNFDKPEPWSLNAGDTKRMFSFDSVVASLPGWWKKSNPDPDFILWPVLPTGWDDTPRSFDAATVIYGRTVEKFRKCCVECREFCEDRGIRRVIVAPVNEWQEGSYIEPNEEFGFGMYDAIRDAFCVRPPDGWPTNLVPRDVGLGPYDFPPMPRPERTSWDFDDGTAQGWYRNPYGTAQLKVSGGCLQFDRSASTNRPAIRTRVMPFDAARFRALRVRMRATPRKAIADRKENPEDEKMTVWWGTTRDPIFIREKTQEDSGVVSLPRVTSARMSLSVQLDSEWHEHEIQLSTSDRWKGLVNEVWLDPVQVPHCHVEVDAIEFK